MEGLNSLSTFGAHPKDFDPEQVKPVLNNLAIIFKWYLKYKDTKIISQIRPEEANYESKEQVDTREVINRPKKKLMLLISGLLLVLAVVIILLFIFNIIGGGKPTKELEKSIAVLPFKLLSDEPDKQYLADGMMDAILLHLCKIEDLRVLSRTSTEKYKEPGKTMTEIGKELGVSYLLEGSFQKFGDNARLIVQLIQTGKEGHVWANEYDRNWNDIFSVQSEVAQNIARELHTVITPEEKAVIEKVPTTNLSAYDLYMRATDYRREYEKTTASDFNFYQKAFALYNAALDIDPSFARAYTGLAQIYAMRYYFGLYFKENFLDSVLILADIALSYDDQLDEAYQVKGSYYWYKGMVEEALTNCDKALKINPNSNNAYILKGYLLTIGSSDFVKGLDCFYNALNLVYGNDRAQILRYMGQVCSIIGFNDKALYYIKEALTLDGDSATYLYYLSLLESYAGNIENAILSCQKAHKINSAYGPALELLSFAGHDNEAFLAAENVVEQLKKTGGIPYKYAHRIGYAFWKAGKYKEADYYFKEQIRIGTESIKSGGIYAIGKAAQYDLAGTYAFLGDKEKAYQYLDDLNTNFSSVWLLPYIRCDNLFDSIRNEERFQKILQDMEAKCQAEHERVGRWMEERGM